MKQEDWLQEIGKAADELGYGVMSLEPSRIEVMPMRARHEIRITVESYHLSGDLLRELLLARPKGDAP